MSFKDIWISLAVPFIAIWIEIEEFFCPKE